MVIHTDLKNQLRERFSGRVRFNEPMAAHTSFRVGGPADVFVTVTDESELMFLVRLVKAYGLPLLVIGGGTNLLVKDQGVRGVVVSMARDLTKISQKTATTLSAMAGASLSALCRFAIHHGLAGMNFALGIPGSVGGAIRMNAGAWKGDMSRVLESVRIIRPDGSMVSIDKSGLVFSYRSLCLADNQRGDLSASVIVEGRFRMSPQSPESLKSEADELLIARKKSQPTGLASAGCFFRNPDNQEPAGKLIDLAGGKTLRVGDAEVSQKHANFIVNRGKASAEDILRLSDMVQEAVFKKFNIKLEPEVKIVGD